MKNKIIYVLSFLLVGVLACNDEFSDTPAIGALSDEILQSETGVDILLVGAYSVLDGIRKHGGSDWSQTGDNWWFDVIADDAHKGSNDSDQQLLYNLEVYDWDSSNSYLLGKWKALFAGVNRCNNVLAKIKGVNESGVQGIDLSRQEGEARFLRAYFNFELQKIFGNVPFISVENYIAEEYTQPNPGAIWDRIEADFQAAIDLLPEELPEEIKTEVGRPLKNTAKAFLGKTKLYQSKWAEALTLFQEVINSGKYELQNEFVDNFRFAGENSKESVFAIQFTADSGSSYNGNRGGTLNFGGPNGWCCGFYQPSQDLVNSFQTAGGLPLLDTYNQTDVTSDYGINSDEAFTPYAGALDPRLDYTVGRRGIEYNGWGIDPGKNWVRAAFVDISGPYLPKKNVYYNGDSGNMGTGPWGQQRSGINYNIMRYADVLLMAAEAAVETGDNATALTYVNMVRNRAKNMTYVAGATNYKVESYTAFTDQVMARKAVRMERRLELGMEGHRLFDVRRWNNSAEIMNAYFKNEARVITSFKDRPDEAPKKYEDKHEMMPIPLQAIDQSENVLEQNTGF